MKTKIKLTNVFKHFQTVNKHKLVVTKLCFKVGLYKQGLLHDLSKYSPVEFLSGARYYQGYRSPIDAEKEELGYSLGWLHHKGCNKHHWEYWVDKNKNGLFPIEIPLQYVKEMACDRIAACMIYQQENYQNSSPYDYFMKGTDRLYMHPNSAKELESFLIIIKDNPLDVALNKIKKK